MKTFFLFFVIAALLLINGCKKDNDNDIKSNVQNGYVRINANLTSSKSSALLKSALTISATKVLVFNWNGDYIIKSLEGSAFQVDVKRDAPVAIIFTNDNNEFLGYFCFNNGIDMLPLQQLNDTVSIINLGDIITNNNQVICENAVFENYFSKDPAYISTFYTISQTFNYSIQHPDANQNGTLDILEEKFHKLIPWYWVSCAYDTSNNSCTFDSTNIERQLHFMTSDKVITNPYPTFLNPNPDAGVAECFLSYGTVAYNGSNNQYIEYISALNGGGLPVDWTKPALCNVAIEYKNENFTYSLCENQTPDNLVYIFPKFEIINGMVSGLSWSFKTKKGDILPDDLITFITRIEITIQDKSHNNILEKYIYDSKQKNISLDNQIFYSNIGQVFIRYDDIFNNAAIFKINE